MTRRARSHKRLFAVLAVIVLVVVLVGAWGIRRVYVTPHTDLPLHRADAVVVLGGTPYERFRYGVQLAEQGLAPEVVLSNSLGADNATMQEICGQGAAVRITCFLPVPWTTRGEAQEIRKLAGERDWKDIIVVTTTAHIERARMIVGRCFAGTIQMSTYPETRSVVESVDGWIYQTGGWIRALTQRGC